MSTPTRHEIRYLMDTYPGAKYARREFTGHPYAGRTVDGYGRKIPTDHGFTFEGRWHRVYCCQLSNAGSMYVLRLGRWLFVCGHDIPAGE